MKGMVKLPCGGSITYGNEGETCRVHRVIGAGDRKVVIILAHPPRLLRGETDDEQALCVEFSRLRDFHDLCILYLLPYPARDIKELKRHDAPWGPGPNNRRIQDMEVRLTSWSRGGLIVAAWGDAGRYANADARFTKRHDGSPQGFSASRQPIIHIQALGFTPSGAPAPLNLRNLAAPLCPLFPEPPPAASKARAQEVVHERATGGFKA